MALLLIPARARHAPSALFALRILSIPVLVSACAGDPPQTPGWIERDSSGITIVENEYTRPAWDSATAWRLRQEPLLRIGTASNDPSQQLFRVMDSEILSDGRIAVVNTGSSDLRIYNRDGTLSQALGRQGEGPGEFRTPWVVHQIRGDSILVLDLYREISIFDSGGRFIRRFVPERPEGTLFGEGYEPVDRFGDGSLLFRSHYREDQATPGVRRNRIRMVRMDLDGSLAGSLGDFDDQTLRYGGGLFLFGAWAQEAASDTTMWYGPGDRFEIREVAFDGSTVRLVRLNQPPRAVTAEDVEEYGALMLERARGTPREQFVNRRISEAEYPETFPFHFEIETDADGNLWVQDYQLFDKRVERNWAVFDPEGHYLGTVVLPAGFVVHRIGHDYVLGVWRDELDIEYVHVYSLDKPGG